MVFENSLNGLYLLVCLCCTTVLGAQDVMSANKFSTSMPNFQTTMWDVPKDIRGVVRTRLSLRGGSYYQGVDEEPVILNKRKTKPAGDSKPRPPKEDAPLAKVSHDLKKAIMQARQAKKMTQKDLAKALNESVQTIQWYESGKIVPNNALIAKMEKVLGSKLPRVKKERAKADPTS